MTQEEFIYFRNERELYLDALIEKLVTGKQNIERKKFFYQKLDQWRDTALLLYSEHETMKH
ncbi:hypothetical protein [Priestia endophytica]|uniref:Uncharacterized protein n=1 Tax=Priestia endophytica DSM 13796 TaxID=1121089 RepID=A0A1I5YP08_9BACI|nr:hypothetical protein [Priestia endophytica]KYG33639.1 hypothetical protein AZF06_21195 [Priestia endophytica]SFQ45815.1 hypothetical protein SAMN02745910_01446 [Priestia endophytica DSM 13796]